MGKWYAKKFKTQNKKTLKMHIKFVMPFNVIFNSFVIMINRNKVVKSFNM